MLHDLPKYVIVKFTGITCPKFDGLELGEVPIFPMSVSFQHKFPGTLRPTTIRRQQLPLVPCYSITSYKSQCKTLSAIITDLIPPHGCQLDASFAYVPLSRVRRLEDLAILRPFPISVLQTTRPNDLVAQDKRFAEMDAMLI